MPERAPQLFRAVVLRPVIVSLLPALVLLWALDSPVRSIFVDTAARRCEDFTRVAVFLLQGSVRNGTGIPGEWNLRGEDRIVLEDAKGRIVVDSRNPSAGLGERADSTWQGPRPDEPVEIRPAQVSRDGDGMLQVRCEARWGTSSPGGALVVLRSLQPIEAWVKRGQLALVLIWSIWAVSYGWFGMRAYRRVLGERDALRRALGGIPERADEPNLGAESFLSLERDVREAGRRAMAEADRLRADLHERDAVLQGMLEGVVAVDARRVIVLINPSAERILGLPPGTGRGRRISELVRNGAFLGLVEEILERQRSGELEFDLEDGARRVRVLGDALRGPGRDVRGAVLVMGDVTDLRRLERVRRDFVANVSHELKTPITAIQGYVETLVDGEEDPEIRRRFLRVIASNTHRMHRILEDLLSLSRVESAGGEIDRLPVDIRTVIDRVVDEAQEDAARRSVALERHYEDGVGVIEGNEALLERALENLIDNAIKYGKERSTVHVRAAREGGSVRLEVRDEGPGIAAPHLPRLFERFYRVDKGRSREMGGTGLGLAIVKHIALAHGGEAGVESRPGIGSTFFLRIPIRSPGTQPSGSGRGSDGGQAA